MKALTVWQPWASLIMAGWKRYETRHWATFYRGPLAIHAAQRLITDIDDRLWDMLAADFGMNWPKELPRGRMLGTVRLTDCKHTEAFDVDAIEQLCGDWTPGRFAWRLDDFRTFDSPPEVKGRQGFFSWHDPAWMPPEPQPARLI